MSMKRLKKAFALGMCLAMSFSMAAGSVSADSESVIMDNGRLEKLVIGMSNDPQEFSPWNPNNLGKNLVWHQIYECLFDLDGAEYVPVLAKGYTAVDDTTYDVEIYDYIVDALGNPVTADDVVYSYQVLIDSGYGIKYDIFEGVEKVDDYTVRFSFSENPMEALGALEFIWAGTAIFSQAAYEEYNFATEPIGTGPYVISEYQSGSKVILDANDNYWQEEDLTLQNHKRNVQTIEYDIIAEASSQTVALTTGAIQYSNSFDTESLSEFEEGGQYASDFVVSYEDSNTLYYLQPNCLSGGIMDDINLRKAIFYALDNTQISAAVSGLDPAYGMGTSIFADYNEEWESAENYITTYDLDTAKEYLEQSAYNGEALTLITYSDEEHKNMSTIIVALLSQLGINVNMQALDSNSYQTTELDNGAWDLALTHCSSGGFCISLSQVQMDNTINDDDMTINNIADDKLQELYNLCNTVEGNTAENMNTLYNYWVENAYVCPIAVPVNTSIYSNVLDEICYDNNLNFVPGGSTYVGQ